MTRPRAYVALLYAGCVAGMYAGALVARSDGLRAAPFVAAAVPLLAVALAGSRGLYVARHRERFRDDPWRIVRRSDGGMALYGGLLLSLAVSVPLLAAADLPFWGFWDAAAITMLVGLVFTRVGCTVNGCCAGEPTTGRLALRLPDHAGRWARRRPTPLLEAGWALVVVAGALQLDGTPDGARFAAVVAAYAAGRLALEPTRADADVRLNGAISAALLAGCAAALVLGR